MSGENSLGAARRFISPLPRLRIGSVFVTRSGIQFRVCETIVVVAPSGGESPSVWVERTKASRLDLLFMTVGMLANIVRGAAHQPGTETRIDWAQVPRATQESIRVAMDKEAGRTRSLLQPIWNARGR